MAALSPSQSSPAIAPSKQETAANSRLDQFSASQILRLGNTSLESHLGSVLILTEDGSVLYASESLQDRLHELNGQTEDSTVLPPEIALICQLSAQCRTHFPNQNWAIEFDIFTKDAITLRIRSRWLKLEGFAQPCILLIVEDRQQMVQEMVLDEAQDWGLTPREQEVWLLHQDGHTYVEIADKLFISKNTVKKHMRSIHAKRRAGESL